MRINVKPLSVNEVWKGRRMKTDKYRAYEILVSSMLQPMEIPEGDLSLHLMFGFSNMRADIDNPVKSFTDIISKYYGFNDNRITQLHVCKLKTPKGEEFIDFNIGNG